MVKTGRHRAFGGPHAEVEALDVSRDVSEGAELYVTLEPCSHQGKTPPCTELILKMGVKKVYIAMEDPNPLVAGRGIKKLLAGGVEVSCGHVSEKAAYINRVLLQNISGRGPYIILKYAMSADGFIAASSGDASWISCEESRKEVHRMRHNVQGILVGSGTVIADDPRLNARNNPGGFQPEKIVMDGDHRIKEPRKYRVFEEGSGFLLGEKNLDISGFRTYNFNKTGDGLTDKFITILNEENINSLLVEGGASVLTWFIENRLFDEVCVFVAPILLGGGISPAAGRKTRFVKEALKLERISWKQYGCDMMLRGFV